MPLVINARSPLPAALDCRGIGRLLCQIESRIKKTPASMARVFCTRTNRALGGSGDGGKRPTCFYFGPATILNLYRIAHSESTVDKWDNSPKDFAAAMSWPRRRRCNAHFS